MIRVLRHQLVGCVSKFRKRMKLKQQSKMVEGNFFDSCHGYSNFDGEFDGFELESIVQL